MKTYKAYSFAFTLAALAVASCSKDEIVAKLVPGKPTIVREEGCLDAGLPGVAYFKVTNHTEKQTYRWNIDPLFGAQDTDYSDPYASKIKVNTVGNVGDFTVVVVAANSYGDSEKGELSVNVNKDDFPYAPVELSGNPLTLYSYSFLDEVLADGNQGEVWYRSHTVLWIYNGIDTTAMDDQASTTKGLPGGLSTTTDGSFYVTVTNNSTGCKVRKTAGANGFE
jgi:hypothetical protein